MNNNNMNINFRNPEDNRVDNLCLLSLRPPSPSPPQPPAPPSPTPLAQPHPVYSPPMELLSSNYPPFMPELDLIPSSPPPTYPTMDSKVAVNNKPPPPPLGRGRPPRNPRNNGDAHLNRKIKPPYPWATDRPAFVHNKAYLERHFIYTVTGTVHCNKCGKEYPVVFNIEEKLNKFVSFVESRKGTMHNCAPEEWRTPSSLVCEHCTGDGVKPVIDVEKDNINWLFLFLGQMLGCCTLEQIKYFCLCTKIHRTGSKDRILYLTYREIFKQLLPHLPHKDPW